MKKYSIASLLLVCVYAATYAQNTISGKVTDAAGNGPLSGASISSGGKTIITTAKDGTFSIDCKYAGLITVSFVGYETYKQQAKCGDNLNIVLIVAGSTLDNVEITATSSQNKSLLYQPSSITKLNETELNRGNGLFLDDAINGNVPGVTMNRRAVSSGQQFNIRGYGNGSRGTRGTSSNFDGQGYKVYLNGIPITDAEGITVMDDLDFGSVGNVEVVKGPAGTLYGLAIAGVVNLETMNPKKGTSIGQDVMVGNYGLQRYTTRFQTSNDRSSLMVNYGHQESDGYVIHNSSWKNFVNAIGRIRPNEKQEFNVYFGYSNSYDQRNGELTIAQWNSNDYSGNINYIRNNAHSRVNTVRAGIGHTYTFSSRVANTTTVFATGFNNDASSAGGWSDKTTMNLGVRSTFDTKFTFANGLSLSGITGIESQRQNGQTTGYNMKISPFDTETTGSNPWVIGRPYYVINAITSNFSTVAATTSLFTEWTLALPRGLSFTAGIGHSNMIIRLDDRFNSLTTTFPTHYEKTYNGMYSPHVAVNKVFNSKVSVYAAYSKGYKAPVSSYFYITTPVVANPPTPSTGSLNESLKPEKGDQFEIGTKGTILNNSLVYQLALFNATFSDKMTTVAVPLNNTTTAYSYVVNGGKQDHKGVEAFLKYIFSQSKNGFFTLAAPYVNFTYSDFEYKNFQFMTGNSTSNLKTYDFSGSPVAGVSKVVFSMGIDVDTKSGLYGNINHLYRDKMPITAPDTLYASSYNLLNGKLGYRKNISSHFDIDISFGVNNITGTKYPIMIFVNQIPDAYIAGPRKANYFATLKLTYNH